MAQEIVVGRITSWGEDGTVAIAATVPDLQRALHRRYDKCLVAFTDNRKITPDQRRKIYALINDVADFIGDNTEPTKRMLKVDFVLNRLQAIERKMFSLSNVDEATASEFISYIIDFMLEHDIPSAHRLGEMAEDVGRYVYACLMAKKCAVCGKPADLHHVDAIGAGVDRTETVHIGREALPLCRPHHTEAHKRGRDSFMGLYHLQPVKIDRRVAKAYRLNTKE